MFCMFFIYFTQLSSTNSYSVHMKLPEINETVVDPHEHLKYSQIKTICESRDAICKGNDTNLCSLKYVNGSIVYKDFINSCYMFLSNMCDVPGDEYYIVSSGSCKQYVNTRRDAQPSDTSPREDIKTIYSNKVTSILRNKIESTFIPLYEVDTAFDLHNCPYSCPDTYSPVCVNVNRSQGKYFKFLMFVNHCSGDLYYCKNTQEFAPPYNGSENVKVSQLDWSHCAASKYIQFSRFAETASAMGHYGWLAGKYRYSHIMEPHQRIPGYG